MNLHDALQLQEESAFLTLASQNIQQLPLLSMQEDHSFALPLSESSALIEPLTLEAAQLESFKDDSPAFFPILEHSLSFEESPISPSPVSSSLFPEQQAQNLELSNSAGPQVSSPTAEKLAISATPAALSANAVFQVNPEAVPFKATLLELFPYPNQRVMIEKLLEHKIDAFSIQTTPVSDVEMYLINFLALSPMIARGVAATLHAHFKLA